MSFLNRFRRNRKSAAGKLNFIDVGSAGPLPSPWNNFETLIDTILKFEPRDKGSSAGKVISINCALWDKPCERDFYIYAGFNGTGSSLFRQNQSYVAENFDTLSERGPGDLALSWMDRSRLIRTETVQCRTLDDVVEQLHDKAVFDFLKVDAQGAEYQILNGGLNYLRNDCQGMMLELFTLPLYEGIKLADEVMKLLESAGFRLVKKLAPHGTFDSQNDCLFLREDIRPEIKSIVDTVYQL